MFSLFWIINQKEREEIKRNKNSVAPKFFPWLKTAFLPF
jgi:hypothetical protein